MNSSYFSFIGHCVVKIRNEKKKIENNKNATKNSCIEKKVKKLKNARTRVVEKKVEDRGKTVKNYKKKVEERKNACSGRKEKLKSMVKEIVKSVKSVVKVRSVEKACSGKKLKKRCHTHL